MCSDRKKAGMTLYSNNKSNISKKVLNWKPLLGKKKIRSWKEVVSNPMITDALVRSPMKIHITLHWSKEIPAPIYGPRATFSGSAISHTQLWQPIICETQTATFWGALERISRQSSNSQSAYLAGMTGLCVGEKMDDLLHCSAYEYTRRGIMSPTAIDHHRFRKFIYCSPHETGPLQWETIHCCVLSMSAFTSCYSSSCSLTVKL